MLSKSISPDNKSIIVSTPSTDLASAPSRSKEDREKQLIKETRVEEPAPVIESDPVEVNRDKEPVESIDAEADTSGMQAEEVETSEDKAEDLGEDEPCELCDALYSEGSDEEASEMTEEEINQLAEVFASMPDTLDAIGELTVEQQNIAKQQLIEMIEAQEIEDAKLQEDAQEFVLRLGQANFGHIEDSATFARGHTAYSHSDMQYGFALTQDQIEELCNLPTLAGLACLSIEIASNLFDGQTGSTFWALVNMGISYQFMTWLLTVTSNPFFIGLGLLGVYLYLKNIYC